MLFNLFETEWEYRPQHTNPCRKIERGKEEERDRVLTDSELRRLAAALKDYQGSPAAVAAIRVASLTGLRVGEVLGMQWGHIDFETGRLTIPESKTGRRQHHLPEPALSVLRQLAQASEHGPAGDSRFRGLQLSTPESPFCFTSTGKAPCTDKNVRKHFKAVCSDAGIEGARLHDLRRTVMTKAAEKGVGSHVLRDLLGHKTTAMADRYIRALGEPVREAREQVGAEIAAAMDGG